MHADEVATDAALVRRLLAAQFPQWAGLAITPVPSSGTDHALYRLGGELCVRLPRIARAVAQVEKEQRWLPRLAPLLPLAIPEPVAEGTPGEGYPFPWSVYAWVPGEDASAENVADLRDLARALGHFVTALQAVDLAGGPEPGPKNFFRGVPLAVLDAYTRGNISKLAGELDAAAVTAEWEGALRAPVWPGPPTWIHGDLSATNLLVADGRLRAVIDFGGMAVGDPACDLLVAWTPLFTAEARDAYRAAVALDDVTWARGRGWALYCGLAQLAYYTADTNPVLVQSARHGIAELLATR